MEGHSLISADVLSTYAADAAGAVAGVRGLVEGGLHRGRGVRINEDADTVEVELHVTLDWGVNAPEVGRAVQTRVADYLGRMANVRPRAVRVIVDEVGAPPAP